jgi:hypothetical protein
MLSEMHIQLHRWVKWAHMIARIDSSNHFTPRIGGRPIWWWFSVSDPTAYPHVCIDSVPLWPSLGALSIRPSVGVAPTYLATPTIAKWAHIIYSEQFFTSYHLYKV